MVVFNTGILVYYVLVGSPVLVAPGYSVIRFVVGEIGFGNNKAETEHGFVRIVG